MKGSLIAALLLVATSTFAAPLVKRLNAYAEHDNWNGRCPHEFRFISDITSRYAGEVSYQWIRSDGAAGRVEWIHFNGPNQERRVFTRWTINRNFRGWEQLRVQSRNGDVNYSRKVNFNLRCR